MKKETKYIYFLTLLYFVISWIGISHHELWLDEAHHWLLARDSVSILDLFKNTRYEGHPILWNILLFGITRFTLNPFWMQFLHILISTTVVFIFLRKAPFSLVFKTLFIFGYFILFEYNVISRNYILGVLFLFLACSVFKDRNTKFTLLCVYLALAANIHMMFTVVALALFMTLLLEKFQNKQLHKSQFILGYLFFVSGIILFLFQMQTTNSDWLLNPYQSIHIHEKLTNGFISLFKGIVTIPDFRTVHFWNSNFLINLNKPICAILGLFIYVLPFLLFYKNRRTLFFVYIALFGIQIFFFITQRGATRFDGCTYIILIIALWIENYFSQDDYKIKVFLNATKINLIKRPIFYIILTIQLFSGIFAYYMDYKFPFTSSKATVDFLKENHLNTKEIITITCDGTSISPYLEKKVFFLCDGSYESFCSWNFSCAMHISQKNIQELIINYLNTNNEAVFVSNYSITNSTKIKKWEIIDSKIRVRFLKKFKDNILKNSYYYVYEVERINKFKK